MKKCGSLKQNEVSVGCSGAEGKVMSQFSMNKMKNLRQLTYKIKMFIFTHGSAGYQPRLNSPVTFLLAVHLYVN